MKHFEKMNVTEMMEINGGASTRLIDKKIIINLPIILPPIYELPVIRPVVK